MAYEKKIKKNATREPCNHGVIAIVTAQIPPTNGIFETADSNSKICEIPILPPRTKMNKTENGIPEF